MQNNLTPELVEQAKAATSAAELLALAAEKGIELTPAEAASYYVQLHPQSGALPDEELDNVAGGSGCYNQTDGRLIITGSYSCDHWICYKCGLPVGDHSPGSAGGITCYNLVGHHAVQHQCCYCAYHSLEGIAAYCQNPANRISK